MGASPHHGPKGFFRKTIAAVLCCVVTSFQMTGLGMAGRGGHTPQAADIEAKISKEKDRIRSLERRQKDLLASLEQVELRLARSRQRRTVLRQEMEALTRKAALTREAMNGADGRIRQTAARAAARFVAYYKLTQTGTAPIFLSADSAHNLIWRQKSLEQILTADQRLWEDLRAERDRKQTLARALEAQKKARGTLESRLGAEIEKARREKAEKSQLLARIHTEESLARAALDSLEQAAKNLEKTLQGLDGGAAPVKAGETTEQDRPFGSLKGRLSMPVAKGSIVSSFGVQKDPRFHVPHYRRGIRIEADPGEPIHAVAGGKVVYAGWLKGYGNMIIIDHGRRYHTVSAHAEALFKNKGDVVVSDEIIGTVGDTGSLSGPGLYFEVRHLGRPEDPSAWFKKGK